MSRCAIGSLLVLAHAGFAVAQAPQGPAPEEPQEVPTLQVRRLPEPDQTAPAQAAPAEVPPPDASGGPTQPSAPSTQHEGAAPRRAEADPDEVWYGWQTLTVDGLSLGLDVLGLIEEQVPLALVGGLGLYFGTPIVHFAHARSLAGGVSLIARLLVGTVATFGLLACVGNAFSGDEGAPASAGCEIALIASLGLPLMIAIDAAVLAWEPRELPGHSSALRPWLDARTGSTGLAYGLVF